MRSVHLLFPRAYVTFINITTSVIIDFFDVIEGGMRDKTADLITRQNSRFNNETKQLIFKTKQNSRFSKRGKTNDFQNGTKQPIFKTEQNVTGNMQGT